MRLLFDSTLRRAPSEVLLLLLLRRLGESTNCCWMSSRMLDKVGVDFTSEPISENVHHLHGVSNHVSITCFPIPKVCPTSGRYLSQRRAFLSCHTYVLVCSCCRYNNFLKFSLQSLQPRVRSRCWLVPQNRFLSPSNTIFSRTSRQTLVMSMRI